MNSHAPRSCASCDETDCAMHRLHATSGEATERTAWVLDDVWPETASMVVALFKPDDQLLAPGLFGRRPQRYRWPVESCHAAGPATLSRHVAMRRAARASGAIRQQSYLRHDRRIARALAKAIDYRARHLVVAQTWLPWLDEIGALGGRSFDVVMHRYPMADIHALLDAAAAEIGWSETITDFRADPELVEREARLLQRARRIVTPHHGVAARYPETALQLAWHLPPPVERKPGSRVAFLGPTIARERPDVARSLAASLETPLIVFGRMIESATVWDGIRIERREMGPGWLDEIGTILNPAALTHQPRKLLQAIANGVEIYSLPTSGLDPESYRPLAGFAA